MSVTTPPTEQPRSAPPMSPNNRNALIAILVGAAAVFVVLGVVVAGSRHDPARSTTAPPVTRYALGTTTPTPSAFGGWLNHVEGALHNVASDLRLLADAARADNLVQLKDECDAAYVFRDDLAAAAAEVPDAALREPLESFVSYYRSATDACSASDFGTSAAYMNQADGYMDQARAVLDAYRASH